MINASNEGSGFEFCRKNPHNLGFPTFKLPASTKHILRITRYLLFLTISVYDY